MKFGIAKLPQTFYKDTENKFKRKKKQNNKELSLIEDRKAKQIFVTKEAILFSLCKFIAVAIGGQGGLAPHFGSLKILFLKYYVTTKSTMMKKGVPLNLTYLTEVTYISSILKFLNTESLVVQVSNTTFNIPSLHL